jgi:U3 small nucleolar RNA-associated protein 4
VVARLALQGEENISSVSISQDGGLLAASTPSTVKLFQLLQPRSGAGGGLRIRKLEMPDLNGAKSVKLSANGKWLAAINATNAIQIVRIVRSEDEADLPRALDKTQYLVRSKRQETAPVQQSGLSQSYGRSITHAEFSADGNVFAVADIAGYIDTWIIEGHEDSTAPEVDIDDTAPVQSADEESDDEDEEEREIVTFLGQHWAQNPSGHLMPQLDSTPVLLSFQPQTDDITHPQPNGNPALHPTRHNPHPHSHELPNASYCLLVVTVDHRMNFLDVMKGRLSEWSRRNQLSSYPPEYLQLDLPAKGCIWDVNEAQQRIWLYGEKWLFMFDLTKDFAVHNSDEAALSKKRKRGGAGDTKPRQELPVTKMRKFGGPNGSEKGNWTDVNTSGRDETDEEDLEADDSQSLAVLRSGSTQEKAHANGETVSVNGEKDVEKQKRSHSGWHTFKYRPILGILPIGPGGGQTPEVVLVERPSWDLDLPPRFVGTHEQS